MNNWSYQSSYSNPDTRQIQEDSKQQVKQSIFEQLLSYDPLIDHMNQNFGNRSRLKQQSDDQIQDVQQFNQYFKEQITEYDRILEKARKVLILDKNISPIQLLHKLKEICESRRNQGDRQSICQMYAELKINSESLASVLDRLEQVKVIPKNGLSNNEIEKIFEIYQQDIPSFKWLGILTSDFMVCDVQQYFKGGDLNMTQTKIENSIDTYLKTGQLNSIDTRKGHPLAQVDVQQLEELYRKGKYHIGMVINTDRCIQGGSHWVALYLNLKKKQILFFNSVGSIEYRRNLEPVKQFCRNLQQMMDQMSHGGRTTVEFLEDDIQNINNICGVYCILFITCQMFGIDYQQVQELLKYERNRGETFVQLFKTALFG